MAESETWSEAQFRAHILSQPLETLVKSFDLNKSQELCDYLKNYQSRDPTLVIANVASQEGELHVLIKGILQG